MREGEGFKPMEELRKKYQISKLSQKQDKKDTSSSSDISAGDAAKSPDDLLSIPDEGAGRASASP